MAGAALVLAGCVSLRPDAWWPTEPAFVAPHAGFEVTPPPGWMREWYRAEAQGSTKRTPVMLPTGGAVFAGGSPRTRWVPGDPEVLVVTRDGTTLQLIVVGANKVGERVPVGGSERVVTAGMSPQELAELVVDGIAAVRSVTDVRVVESAPATLSGRTGFRAIVSFRDGISLRRRLAFYGVVEGDRFYHLAYLAPERVYFERDLPTFEALVESFRLRPPVPEKPPRRRGAR